MATLYKKPRSENWYAQYFDADGTRVSKSTGTPKKRDARLIATRFEADEHKKKDGVPHLPKAFSAVVETAAREAAAGELTLARTEDLVRRLHQLANPTFQVVSLEKHLAAWVEAQKPHVSESTQRIYEDMRRRVLAALGPNKAKAPVGDLAKRDVEQAIAKITETRIKGTKRTILASTANMDLRALRRALESAVEQKLARTNVAKSVRQMSEKDSTERAPFSAQEVRKLIDHPETTEEWKGCILLAAHTGLRLGDVIKLSREHVQGDRIIIRPEKTKRAKKSLSIPISPPCLSWIGERTGDFFPTLRATKTGTLSTTFTRIMARAGVPRDISEAGGVMKRRSFHSLRHSFASWLAEADIHADVRQKLTGHSSSQIHAKYTHHDEALDRAVATLPAL